jgi:C-methyltransferase C-terminal domain/Putative zinc binding domain/Methyltransferase domain
MQDMKITSSGTDPCLSRATSCRLCGASVTASLVDLGMSPLCESFVSAEQLDNLECYYPLHPLVCGNCFLVQLKQYVTPDRIFCDYAYFSSYSTSWIAHAKAYCEMITTRFGLGADSLAIELASNDGYLLQHFGALGVPCLGIEPAANVANIAIGKGIPTIVEFFGTALAEKLAREGRQADLIIGNNVLAQIPLLNDFVAGIKLLLKSEGIVTLEFPHLERLMAENQFDTIYHEHFSYFSLTTTEFLAKKHGLKLIDVEQLPSHGGSLRVYLAHQKSAFRPSPEVAALLRHEASAGFCDLSTYQAFTERVQSCKRQLLNCLIALKNDGKRICGYGAPGKGNTLLNYCGIGTDFLDFTVDRNPYKHGRYTPGMHVPILPVDALDSARPDYILILPWNLQREIIAQMAHAAEWGAKFIVPIPETTIIDVEDQQR